MADWRPAKSLVKLRAQINAMAPNRSKASDGTIGDTAHSKTKSEHNPNKDGVVRAMDITHDPAGGCDCNVLAETLVAARDPRILYIIWNARICSSVVQPWTWRAYKGANKHTHHLHISVVETPAVYDNEAPWLRLSVGAAPVPRPRPSEPVPAPPDVEPAPEQGKAPTGLLGLLLKLLKALFGKK
jgi:hypothetical protein